MAIALKPTVLPRFAETAAGVAATNIAVPTSGQQDTGWTTGQAPPSGVFNFLLRYIYDWIQYVRDAVFTATAASALDGLKATGDGVGAGVNGFGGASGPGVAAAAGGGGAPVRGALALTVQAAPTGPVNGDVWSLGSALKTYLGGASGTIAINESMGALSEGFETACPPATGGWTAPSRRYAGDFAFFRDTSTPITGTASANRSVSQTASTNSSLGLDWFLPSPARLAFYFDVLCNQAGGDSLQFYVDGVLTAQIITPSNTQNAAGRFVTDVLVEGPHTFDWRYLRGASAAVGGEKCRIDIVEIVAESRWMDQATRLNLFSDFLSTSDINAGSTTLFQSGFVGNVGLVTVGNTGQSAQGSCSVSNAAVAVADTEFIQTGCYLTSTSAAFLKPVFWEVRMVLRSNANVACWTGLADAGSATPGNSVQFFFDSAVGANWKLKTVSGGVSNAYDTGIVADIIPHRFGISYVPTLGVCATIDGKSLPALAATTTMATSLNLPLALSNMEGGIGIASRVGVAQKIVDVDWARLMQLR